MAPNTSANCAILLFLSPLFALAKPPLPNDSPTPMLRQYCFGCHGKFAQMGGINLEELSDPKSALGERYQQWRKVISVLETKRMPPAQMPQPSDGDRSRAATWIRASLQDYIDTHAGDPGRVTVRRLTSGEYAYTIQDLTGLDLKFDRDFVGDSVGGEGFANFGDVQFMQDASLERYLEAAKHIASRAVIGSGPIQFFIDPGKSGLEMSALTRINKIYAAYGFRGSSGEGGKPFGVDRYGKALYACWLFQHRAKLRKPHATLASFAEEQGVTPRFAGHLWTLLHKNNNTYPTSEAVRLWRKIPAPLAPDEKALAAGRAANLAVQQFIVDWPRRLLAAGEEAAGGLGDERALILTEETLAAKRAQEMKFTIINRGKEKRNPTMYLSAAPVNPSVPVQSTVYWHNPTLRVRAADKSFGPTLPLRTFLTPAAKDRLKFGVNGLSENDFATVGEASEALELNLPEKSPVFEFNVKVEVGDSKESASVVRCTLSDQPKMFSGRPVSTLIANPETAGYKTWKAHVLDFAANLPVNSQGEAAPSDKDPIPAPYDNTYNQRERDAFHPNVKYYRTDQFLMQNVLDDANRAKLNQAWNDLLASFDYHDQILKFIAEKYKLDLKGKTTMAELDEVTLQTFPAEPRQYLEKFRNEFHAVRDSQLSGQPQHIDDCLHFAAKAWRRPLTPAEKTDLRSFYTTLRNTSKLEHSDAIRALLSRILVAPAFLYRLEQSSTSAQQAGTRVLPPLELAARMSYFLWSSLPDAELERAAKAGELNDPMQVEKQVSRMLHDPKARRMATEFFGQWLGFYRFDQFNGVDTTRFPEFTDEVKSAMYDEAVSFFDNLIRQDRPVREMFTASYTFLNQPLAKHYGVTKPVKSPREMERVDHADNRGGVFRLGAVLTATSAPLRTSPVKRGDWVLRRILGTPTPPPPADAGSIPGDEKAFGGLTLKEKLAAHQRNATCAGCHSRIDPLGFPLEHYDSVGRWRDKYQDGKPVDDHSTALGQKQIIGVDGLIEYLKTYDGQVARNMSQKMLGYALGRTALASDEPLIEELARAGGDATVAKMATGIIMSRQFRYRREEEGNSMQTASNRGSAK